MEGKSNKMPKKSKKAKLGRLIDKTIKVVQGRCRSVTPESGFQVTKAALPMDSNLALFNLYRNQAFTR